MLLSEKRWYSRLIHCGNIDTTILDTHSIVEHTDPLRIHQKMDREKETVVVPCEKEPA